jgi:hypothetical protein
VVLGLYGQDATLFDTAGPFGRIMDMGVSGAKVVVVDPLFVAAYLRMTADSQHVAFAYLDPVAGPFNEFTAGTGFLVLKVIVRILLILAFLYGVWHYFKLPLVYVWQRFVRRGPVSIEWISPFTARFWQPYHSTAMRLSSLYSLLAWIINWRYRMVIGSETVLYYSSLFCTIVGFCMMVNRWCGFARKVHNYREYQLLGYWALVEIPIATMAGVFAVVLSATKSFAIQKTLLFVNAYILNPSLTLMAFAFFLTAVHFLYTMRRLNLQQDALHSLRKMTIVSIVGFFLVATITVFPLLYSTHVIQHTLGHWLTLADLAFFWILYHTLVFYLLSVKLPKATSTRDTVVVNPPDDNKPDRKSTELIDLSTINADEQDSPSAVWNSVVLQGLVTERRQYRLRNADEPTNTEYGMTTSLLSLRDFNTTADSNDSLPSPSLSAEMAHYFQKYQI